MFYQRACTGNRETVGGCCNSGGQIAPFDCFALMHIRSYLFCHQLLIMYVSHFTCCRKHMPVVMNSKFQIVPIISWKIWRGCLMQIMFQLRCSNSTIILFCTKIQKPTPNSFFLEGVVFWIF